MEPFPLNYNKTPETTVDHLPYKVHNSPMMFCTPQLKPPSSMTMDTIFWIKERSVTPRRLQVLPNLRPNPQRNVRPVFTRYSSILVFPYLGISPGSKTTHPLLVLTRVSGRPKGKLKKKSGGIKLSKKKTKQDAENKSYHWRVRY